MPSARSITMGFIAVWAVHSYSVVSREISRMSWRERSVMVIECLHLHCPCVIYTSYAVGVRGRLRRPRNPLLRASCGGFTAAAGPQDEILGGTPKGHPALQPPINTPTAFVLSFRIAATAKKEPAAV